MIDFQNVTHIIANPQGHAPSYNYSLVGSVPASMLDRVTPTREDIMAGRVKADGYAYKGRKWETVAEILAAANAAGDVNLCTSSTCSCRKLF